MASLDGDAFEEDDPYKSFGVALQAVIEHAVTTAMASISASAVIDAATHNRDRPNTVINAVSVYAQRLPYHAQARFTEIAVQEVAAAGLGPDPWLDRKLQAHLPDPALLPPDPPTGRTCSYRRLPDA